MDEEERRQHVPLFVVRATMTLSRAINPGMPSALSSGIFANLETRHMVIMRVVRARKLVSFLFIANFYHQPSFFPSPHSFLMAPSCFRSTPIITFRSFYFHFHYIMLIICRDEIRCLSVTLGISNFEKLEENNKILFIINIYIYLKRLITKLFPIVVLIILS